MNSDLKLIIFEEKNVLQELLTLLDKQYNSILSDEITLLDKLNEDIEIAGKKIATIEIKRRDIIRDNDLREIIKNSDDKHLKDVYKEVRSLVVSLELQKDTNYALIKQRLFFTNKIINVIRPSKSIGTYNAYGNVK